MPCVTSSGAKVRPLHPGFYRGTVVLGSCRFPCSQSVCAIAGDTSQDPAGTSPAFWRDVKNRAHQRHALERSETERHHHRARNRRCQRELSRSKKFWSANRLLFSFFKTPDDQRGVAGQSERGLASECRWQMAIAGIEPWKFAFGQ